MKTAAKPDDPKNNGNAKFIQTVFTLPKQRRKAFVAVCSAFVFMLFFLMPLDLYLNNFIDFNISLGTVALSLLPVSIVVFFALVLVLPLIFRGKLLDVATLLLCGVLLASYVQMLFLNGEMTTVIGGTDYTINLSNTLSRLIYFIVVFVPLCIWKGLQDSKTLKNIRWETGIASISIIILGMQAAGLLAAMPGYDPKVVSGPNYLSYNKAFQLSSEGNICVFITDTLDVKYMKEALEKYPELHEQLDGFTFYENNVSSQIGTLRSTTQMLTGQVWSSRDSIIAYFEKAWARHNFIDILHENGYNSTLLICKATFGSFNDLKGRADNLAALKESDVKKKYSKIAETVLNISFSRAAPYYFKNWFILGYDAGFSNYFFEWPDIDVSLPAINNSTDIRFYNNLKTAGLYTQDERPTFTIAHLNCAHDKGYRYNPDADTVELYDDGDSVRGCFAILNEYFNQMKKLDIYDNSTIIIIADHGAGENMRYGELKVAGEITSSLLIKPENKRGNLEIDMASELSHENFRASILQIAGLPHEDFGLSYFDIIDGRLPQKRELYAGYNFGFVAQDGTYEITRDGSNPGLIGVYEITGDANDFSNWVFRIQKDE
jgi:hypothetical protein